MKREEFLACVREPFALPASSSKDLEEIVRMYPYFQGGYILHALSLHQTNEIRFPEALKNAALHSGDRRQLYNLIHLPKNKHGHLVIAETEGPQEKTIDFIEETLAETIKSEVEQIIETEESAQTNSEPVVQVDNIPNTNNVTIEESPSVEQELEIPTPIESDIIAQILDYPEIQTHESEAKINEQSEHVGQTNEDGNSEKRSFSDWLKRIHPSTNDLPLANQEQVNENQQSSKTTEAPDHLIERFIQTEPRISKPVKAEFFSPVQMAKKSIEDNDEIVSETLARIFADQGNVERAIRIYQKLSLLYPEKSGYFAALIQKLENPELL